MQTMYPAIPNSPQTSLTQDITDTQTTIEVADGSKLPDAPNLATIGDLDDENAETILYTQKNGNVLSGITRGFQGQAKAWPAGTLIARYFTAYDYHAVKQNIEEHVLNTDIHITPDERSDWNAKETPQGAQAKADQAEANAKNYTDQQIANLPDPSWDDIQDKPSSFPPSSHTHAISDITDLQQVLDSKETPQGAQQKADQAETNAKAYTDTVFDQLNQEINAHKAEIATSTQLGHVKVGQNLTIDSDGTLHAQAGGGKKVARFVIGTSTAGWTENDVDYLCDGVNDQVEINAAIQALPVSGGEIIILDGTYNITAKINVNKSNISIKGNGNATILKRMWNSALIEGVITLDGASNCKVENLRIDGNRPAYTSSNNHGIHLSSSNNNTIIGNMCHNSSMGIYLSSSSNNIITGNTCTNNNITGIYLSASSSNNTITGNASINNSYGIDLISSRNNTVTGNTCNNNISDGIYLSSSDNNTITGNTCNNNGTGIYLASSSNNTITGNTCIRGTGQASDYASNQHTIYLSGSGNNYNLISSNNCMGKNVTISGGTSNTSVNNKYN